MTLVALANEIWVFSADILITSTSEPSPRRCIKVLSKRVAQATDDSEVIESNDDIMDELVKELHDVRHSMVGQIKMGDWDIGYLSRSKN